MMFTNVSSAAAHIATGRLRALAVTSPKRTATAPDVPTMIESGYLGFEISTWSALFLPAKTPAEITNLLHKEADKVINDPDVRRRFANLGVEAISRVPQDLEAYVKAELLRWAKVVKESGASID